ncbi:hypothetical protein CDAR_76571 [Caerostris darwini]|uniref:Bacteriophage/plasmid primase P4 C-terminal domain-containing protein n=1 Tax=Caerostris darwini TaxID=1538125 RepID=A0AAV4QBZ2_9ARAC|nr:hypothetical protein CDAR_76571 [Caerostris darwini]
MLNCSEIKCVGRFNQLAQIRYRFEIRIADANFIKNLNSNLYLFITQNGTIDSSMKTFQAVRWDDYASITCDWEYLSDECPLPEVKHFFEAILPIKEEREFVLHFFS